MTLRFYTVNTSSSPSYWPQQDWGYNNNYYENSYVRDVYSGKPSKATTNWLAGGAILNTLALFAGQNDPDTYRTLRSLGDMATVVGGVRLLGETNRYHEQVYESGIQSRNWYNYNSPSFYYNSGNSPVDALNNYDLNNNWNYWPNNSSSFYYESYGCTNGGGWPWYN